MDTDWVNNMLSFAVISFALFYSLFFFSVKVLVEPAMGSLASWSLFLTFVRCPFIDNRLQCPARQFLIASSLEYQRLLRLNRHHCKMFFNMKSKRNSDSNFVSINNNNSIDFHVWFPVYKLMHKPVPSTIIEGIISLEFCIPLFDKQPATNQPARAEKSINFYFFSPFIPISFRFSFTIEWIHRRWNEGTISIASGIRHYRLQAFFFFAFLISPIVSFHWWYCCCLFNNCSSAKWNTMKRFLLNV